MFKVTVNSIPNSNNLYMGNSNSYRLYSKDKKKWHSLIREAVRNIEKPKKPITLAIVEINYYFKDRKRRDPDNYSGKFLLDPLVALGILVDDNFSVIDTLKVKGFYDKENPRVEITIIPLDKWEE